MRAPTGEQFELARLHGEGGTRAIITEVAAGLRALEVEGVALIDTFAAESTPPFANGIVLAPWPNRIRDGRWLLHGATQQLDLTEPDKGNAIHGLLRSRPYRVVEREAHAITLAATIYPQHGYPFIVDTSVRYELEEDGLTVTHELANRSSAAAPVAVGAHPFFRVGDVPVEELTLTLSATTRFPTDERMNALPEEPISTADAALRHGARVADLDLDTAFGGLARDSEGVAQHRLTAPDGAWTELWQSSDFGFAQVYTPRIFPRGNAKGLAIAIEPMTAAPDSLNNGIGLRWLAPGESWSGRWGVRHGRG